MQSGRINLIIPITWVIIVILIIVSPLGNVKSRLFSYKNSDYMLRKGIDIRLYYAILRPGMINGGEMKQTVNFSDFVDAFEIRKENFTYEGKQALFDYLEEYEESTGEEIELDVIGLCCEYTEYENLKELQENYRDIDTMEELEEQTTVIKIDDDRFIIQAF
ncbi:hypothetical protein LCGC14_2195110 [marine sediment metagenome]|uniref:Uncharacterized protein n=1 Tax=marine sediment metagenome TaxID=412755 RepID=A0A0F9FVU3_9ZZZZ